MARRKRPENRVSIPSSDLPVMMFSMAQPIDIRVRKGRGRSHRLSISLDNLKAAGGPVSLRVVVEANLPRRSKGRRQVREYQRMASYLVDCRTPEVINYVRRKLRDTLIELDRTTLG